MKLTRKWLIVAALVLSVAMATTGTLAYLSDTDSDVNVMTLGNVDIEQLENGETGPIEEVDLYPAYIVGNTVNGLVEKEVTVKNVGESDAYIRTVFAFEAGNIDELDDFEKVIKLQFNKDVEVNWVEGSVTIDDGNYLLAYVTYPKAIAKGETAAASLLSLYMAPEAGNAEVAQFGSDYRILVVSQGVQTINFPDAKTALKVAFGDITAENNPWKGDNATHITATVTTDAELLAAIQDETVTDIFVDGDLTYDWGGNSYASSNALLMKGKSFTGIGANDSITFKGYGSANPITGVTFRNITVKDETVGDNESSWEHGYLEMIDVIADNVVFADTIMLSGNSTLKNCTMNNETASWYGVWVEGGNVVIKDSAFSGTRAVKIHEAYSSEVESVVVDNCTFTLSEKPGVVIGDLNAVTKVTIKNSKFDTQAGDQGKYIYESDTDVSAFNFIEQDNSIVKKVADNEEMDKALKNGDTYLKLGSGNYIIPDSAQGKVLTIVGNGDTVIATQDDGSYEGCDYSLDGATVTFENITINTDSTTYTGYARMKGTYNNCVINGTYTLYGDSTFNNCTFNVTGDVYNIWTWGAPNATFNKCTFNSDGKALLLYGQENTKLTVNNCVFNDNGGLTDLKAAIEIGNDYNKSYNLVVNNATVNGYAINDKGINTGTTLWANKNSMGTDKLNVVVDGVDVY